MGVGRKTKAGYALSRDEALRQKRYMRMALLRNHLTSYILKQSIVDALVAYDADQGVGGPRPTSSMLSGQSSTGATTPSAAMASSRRRSKIDSSTARIVCALRWSDFEDQPSGGIEPAPSESPSSDNDRLYDSGGRRVASCFGGLTITMLQYFGTPLPPTTTLLKMASGTASTSSSTSAWRRRAIVDAAAELDPGQRPLRDGHRAKIVHLRKDGWACYKSHQEPRQGSGSASGT